MSGFAVGFGHPDPQDIRVMLKKIRHRGPDISGFSHSDKVIMAQNYLESNGVPKESPIRVPVTHPNDITCRICWDGEIGNLSQLLHRYDVSKGSFAAERLLIRLYKQYKAGMFTQLNDAIFAMVISGDEDFVAARDLLGIKTLFYARKDDTIYLASELKSLTAVTQEIHEFPPGYYMDRDGRLHRFAELPQSPPVICDEDVEAATKRIKSIIGRSFQNRVDFAYPTGSLLSGGIDSSVITVEASKTYRAKFGQDARLRTFAIGVGESEDLINARLVAEHINSEHFELLVNLDQILEVLPEVIYYLESFDPSLVRSAASNFLVSRLASKHGIQVLLSGEGGDEIFCGYTHLRNTPADELFRWQMECLGFLHNNASLRLDRMNSCHGIRVVTPFISAELLGYVLTLPPEYKIRRTGRRAIEKWILRGAYESELPEKVVWRTKQEFSQGSGSAKLLQQYFEEHIDDNELAQIQDEYPIVRSKEECHYFNLFVQHFGDNWAVKTVGQWITC